MTIYEFDNYKKFIKKWIFLQPKAGRGLYRKMAMQVGVSTTLISQIFNGDKELQLELASDLADFIGLSESETQFFFLLVEYQRAGHMRLKKKIKTKIDQERERAQDLRAKLKKDVALPEVVRSVYYSHWLYTGIRNLSAVEDFRSLDAIAKHLQLPHEEVRRVIDFLVQHGLCVLESGKLSVGPQRTHLESDSPHVSRHHQNWRLQGFQKMLKQDEKNLFYTGPMSLSDADAAKIRQEIPQFIQRIQEIVHPSPSETVRCLNVDWFSW